jgi:hypothetical protein
MFEHIYLYIYIYTILKCMLELCSIRVTPENILQFYETKINTTHMSKIIIDPIIICLRSLINRINIIDKFVKLRIDTSVIVGMHVYTSIMFIIYVCLFMFGYGLCDTILDVGGTETASFANSALNKYFKLLCLFGSSIFIFIVSYIINTYTDDDPRNKITKIDSSDIILFVFVMCCVCIFAYISLFVLLKVGGRGTRIPMFFSGALSNFKINNLFCVIFVHLTMFVFFSLTHFLRRRYFLDGNTISLYDDKKHVCISLILNIFVVCMYVNLKTMVTS